MLLSELTIGQSARVESVIDDGGLAARLMEMGIIPGIELRLIGKAPFGDPLEFELRGYRLSLRQREAECVTVAP